MKPEEIEVGKTYVAGPKSKPRKVVRKGFWWSSSYHGLVYYLGRDGREIELDDKKFAKWAQSEEISE